MAYRLLSTLSSKHAQGFMVRGMCNYERKPVMHIVACSPVAYQNSFTVSRPNTPFKPTSPGNFPGESLRILRAGRPGEV